MAVITTLLLADGATTPVNHNFDPVNVVGGLAKWTDRIGGIALGMPVISHSVRSPSGKANRASKITMKVVVPTLEVTSPSTSTGIQPAPTKAYDLMCNIEFVCPERASLQERKNLLAYVKNLLANAVTTVSVTTDEPVFG
jgi:hypothetical protein